MRSLYVDWDPKLGRWLRPDVTRDEARRQLDHAINDYSTYERTIEVDTAGTLGATVAELLRQWPERPKSATTTKAEMAVMVPFAVQRSGMV